MNAGSESAELVRGWNDVPLDDEGLEEAHRLADKLSELDVTSLCGSTLKRAEQTGRIISKAVGCKYEDCPDLRTWNVGPSLVGKPADDAKPKMHVYMKDEDRVPPQGESFATFRKRAIGAVQKMLEGLEEDQIHVGVTHARVLQLVNAWKAAGRPDDASVDLGVMMSEKSEPGTGGLMVLRPA
jgi:probable phosphoglycerate mutase